jgi:hypothetical protein
MEGLDSAAHATGHGHLVASRGQTDSFTVDRGMAASDR